MEMTLLGACLGSQAGLTFFSVFRGRGGYLGNRRGLGNGVVSLFVNFKGGMWGLDCFCTFVAGFPGEDPPDL